MASSYSKIHVLFAWELRCHRFHKMWVGGSEAALEYLIEIHFDQPIDEGVNEFGFQIIVEWWHCEPLEDALA